MARVNTVVSINAVNVSTRVYKWKVEETFGNEIPDATIQLSRSVLTTLAITNGQVVIIQRGYTLGTEQNVFRGLVDSIQRKGAIIEVKAKNSLITLVKTDINTSFDVDIDPEAGVGSAIANTLITEFGGMSTNSGTTVTGTGAVVLLEKFRCRKTDIFERLRTIADVYDYQIFFNYDDQFVYFQPTGATTNANNLIIGTNVSNLPEWQFDNSQLVNQIRVEGAEEIVETTESGQIGVTAGYTTASVTLNNSPFSVRVFADAANPPTTLRTGGTPDSTASFDYSVDEQNSRIVWSDTYTPGAADFVEVRYGYPTPIPVVRRRQVSIDAYGLSATTKHFSDIKTVEDAITRGNLFLNTYSQPFIRVKLEVPSITNDYRAGQRVRILDARQNEDRTLTINKVVKQYPHTVDVIHCGNKEYALAEYNRLTLDRMKRLEEEQSKNDDILIQIIDLEREFRPRRRYFRLLNITKIFDSFILGHPVNGLLGVGTILDNFETGAAANWTSGVSVVDADNAVTFLVGSGSLAVTFSATGSRTLETAQSFGNVSAYTGIGSGTPTQGTCGVWWNSPNITAITAIRLRIGSSASDYIEMQGREYRTVDGYNNWGTLSFGLFSGWNYYLFDLNNPDSTVGTPDWTACDYARFEWTVASNHTGYLDYFTISSSNFIGLNGLGDRSIATSTTGIPLVQGQLTYDEYCYDTTFHDSVNSTATFSTVTQDITFTAGQIWRSLRFDVGTTLSFITVNYGTVVGTLLTEITSDNGATFQTVTPGVRTAVTVSDGTGTFIRITENAAGAATIDLTQNAMGENTEPVVQVVMEST